MRFSLITFSKSLIGQVFFSVLSLIKVPENWYEHEPIFYFGGGKILTVLDRIVSVRGEIFTVLDQIVSEKVTFLLYWNRYKVFTSVLPGVYDTSFISAYAKRYQSLLI